MLFIKKNILILFLIFLPFSKSLGKEFKPGQIYNSIKEKGVIRIGISKNYPPLNFNSGEKGVEVMMIRKLEKFLGVKSKLVILRVADYMESISSNRVDIVIAGFSRNLVRARKIWFSRSYLDITPGVFVKKSILPETRYGDEFEESPIKTIWDLKNISSFKFAVKRGSSYEDLLKNRMPDMPRVMVNTNEEAFRALRNGDAHGFVNDSLILQYLYRTNRKFRSAYELLQGGNQVEKICIGLPFGDTILKNQIDIFVMELIRQKYIEKWLKIYNR